MNVINDALTNPRIVGPFIALLAFVLVMNLMEIQKVRRRSKIPLSQREGAARVLLPVGCEYDIKTVGSAPAERFTDGEQSGFYLAPGYNRIMLVRREQPDGSGGITTLIEARRNTGYTLAFNGAGEPILVEQSSTAPPEHTL